MTEIVLLGGGFARGGFVHKLAVHLNRDPRVDPATRRRLAVVGEMRERVERLALLVDDLAVLVGDVLGRDPVDLLQDLDHLGLVGLGAIREVGGEEPLVAILLGSCVHLL